MVNRKVVLNLFTFLNLTFRLPRRGAEIVPIGITYKDRLSRISFDMFQRLFAEFGCEIVVINDLEDKPDETEIFEEIIYMLHCFSMKMYSKRKNAS